MHEIGGGRLPVRSWAIDADDATIAQALDLANLEVAREHVALMPDAHVGFGMPIGGVVLTDGAVVPYAVGVDIGCGVAFARTDLVWRRTLAPEALHAVLRRIERDVPTGFSVHRRPQVDVDGMIDLVGLEPPPSIARPWLDRAAASLGTLGGGNHFLEVQRDDDDRVCFMLHSGSRNLGKQVCDEFVRRARLACSRARRVLPNHDLAYLRFGEDPDAEAYWAAMTWAMAWAALNRRTMMERAEAAFRAHAPVRSFERVGDVHHNYASEETHGGVRGIVHRKGAVRATAGETVFVPGSMGTASYVGVGLGNPESFETCQHGAGRALGRHEAMRRKSSAEVFAEMAALDIVLRSGEPRTAAEEAPFAYKDIDAVMAASSDLVRPVARLRPLGVVKG
jgi:tRNA-splicing ligase RtcB (3'-phosphate/5'-hydroxy nucleic acid ligase)